MRVAVPLTLSAPLHACRGDERIEVLRGPTMGTSWCAKLVAPSDRPLAPIQEGIEHCLDRVVAQMSTWEPHSDVTRFNRASAGSWQALPDECFSVLTHAIDVARDTAGAYDPTVGPLVDLWGFGPARRPAARPSRAAIASARARIGWDRLTLDAERRRVCQPGGADLDFSAIAKGFAVDLIARFLREAGIDNHLVEIGGELRGHGTKPDGTPWWVALEHPPRSPEDPVTALDVVVALHELSVATSGDYRRAFEAEGRRYSHTIDPRTGWPVAHRLASVTVLHEACMIADALATALMVLGPAAGRAYADRHGIAALFIEREPTGLVEHTSAAFLALLT